MLRKHEASAERQVLFFCKIDQVLTNPHIIIVRRLDKPPGKGCIPDKTGKLYKFTITLKMNQRSTL